MIVDEDMGEDDMEIPSKPIEDMALKSAVGSNVNTPMKSDRVGLRSDVGLSKLPRAQKRNEGDTPFKSRKNKIEKMNDVSP
jgi:hypothetical protein